MAPFVPHADGKPGRVGSAMDEGCAHCSALVDRGGRRYRRHHDCRVGLAPRARRFPGRILNGLGPRGPPRKRSPTQPHGHRHGTSGCDRASTKTTTAWLLCNAAGRSGTVSTQTRPPPATTGGIPRSSHGARRLQHQHEPLREHAGNPSAAPPLHPSNVRLRQTQHAR